jgi:monoamine oxidase
MDRRRFVRLSALAGATVAAGSYGSHLLKRTRDSAEAVVVVGAGLAGLHAAELLRKAGREVVVLEARPHPGGRVQTIRLPFDDGLHAEAGPIRIKATHQTVRKLVRQFGLRLAPFDPPTGSSLVSIHGVTARQDDSPDSTEWRLDLKPEERGLSPRALIDRYLGDLPPDLADPKPSVSPSVLEAFDRVTWPEWLRARGASSGAVTLMTVGADSNTLSALYVLRQIALLRTAGERDFKISGGMDLLPRAMAAALGDVVQYNAPVVRIRRDADRGTVDYEQNAQSRSIVASRVILTIPFSTLRQVEIRPPFSADKARAIAELPYFPATRFLVQSRTRFWRDAGLSGYARTDRPAEIWDCTHDLPGSRGILGVTAGGAVGRAVLEMTDEESVAYGKDLVADAYPEIDANFEKGVAHRWGREPWSMGAFAVLHPGQGTSILPHLATPEDRVHFAGEHTSAWMGWMEGALDSGERAAHEILTAPQ